MKIWKKLFFLSLAGLMVFSTAFAIVGCGKSKDYNKIELNEVTHSIFYAPLYVAINEGFFEEEGLTVTLTNGGGSDTSMTALLTGSADIILAGPETVVYTDQEGISDAPVVFGQLTTCDGSFIVSKENVENFTINDLVGETIIGGRAGGLPAMTLQYIIEEIYGLTIGTGSDEVNLDTSVAFDLTAVTWEQQSGTKYCTLFEPTASNMVSTNSNYSIVASLGEICRTNMTGTIPYTCFIAKSSYLEEHSDVAEKFLRAVMKGYDFIMNSDIDDVAQALLPSFDGNTLDELKVAVEAYKSISAWSSDMILTEDSFTNLMNIMLNAGVISTASNWEDCVDNSIAQKIANEA